MLKTAIHSGHVALGAKMAAFAGYDMPLYYKDGALAEHLWTREHTGIFDVSHMGPVRIIGADAVKFLEKITPSQYGTMADMSARYTVILNDNGGIVDDMIVTKISADEFMLVVNASRKAHDLAYLKDMAIYMNLCQLSIEAVENKSIIAVQGRESAAILTYILGTDLTSMSYMSTLYISYNESPVMVSRTGYTGEDGFEVILDDNVALDFWNAILSHKSAKPVGLAARDSLRLEMGYPLYGSDMDETVSPIEASLGWLISPQNESFIGHERILREKAAGVKRKRFGFILRHKGVLRSGFKIVDEDNKEIGYISSGGYSPILKCSIALAYLYSEFVSNRAFVTLHGNIVEIEKTKFPFVAAKTV